MDIIRIQEKFAQHRPTLQDCRGEYAVLVPLVDGPDGLSLLYEVRSPQLRRHAAEVCFPGGRMEPGENAVQCALRETQEELGISPQHIRILGQLDFLYLRSDGLLHPVLAYVDNTALQQMNYCREEVQDTFLVPLTWLQENPPQIYTYELKPQVGADFPYELVQAPSAYRWSAGRMDVPVYKGLPYPLWGLTGRITEHLVRLLNESNDR